MSASCSIELCTAIPLATKLWPPATVASKTSSTPSGSIGDDPVPQHVVDRVELELGAVEHLRRPAPVAHARGVRSNRRAVVLDSHRLLELRAASCRCSDITVSHGVPHLDGHGVDVRCWLSTRGRSRGAVRRLAPRAPCTPISWRNRRWLSSRRCPACSRRGSPPYGSVRTRVEMPKRSSSRDRSSMSRRDVDA